MYPTSDPAFLAHGLDEVDIANLPLLKLPSDIFLENLADSLLLISKCLLHFFANGEFTEAFQLENAEFAHNAWWRRNYHRLQKEGRGDMCVDLLKLPSAIRDGMIEYNMHRVALAWEFVHSKIGFFGTMGKYKSPRKGLEEFLRNMGLFEPQCYNPQVGEDEWSPDLLAVEEAMKHIINFFVFFLGDPMDKVEEPDGSISYSHVSPVSIGEVVALVHTASSQGVVIFDRRGLPKRALSQYDAVIKERVLRATDDKFPVLYVEEGVTDLTPVYQEVWRLASPHMQRKAA